MAAIDLVVRNSAGAIQAGVIPADVPVTTVTLGSGEDISINMSAAELAGQRRDGNDLVLTLADGREVRLENYFSEGGAPANQLYLSANGTISEVSFVALDDGTLFAETRLLDAGDKWSPYDGLIFTGAPDLAPLPVDDAAGSSAGWLPWLLGAAALGLLAGAIDDNDGGGNNNQNNNRATPTVNDADRVFDIGGDEPGDRVFTVSGTGQPGDTVTVVVGDQTQTTTILPDGTWEVDFGGETLPEDGLFESVVTVTPPADEGLEDIVLDGPGYNIDTTPPALEITDGTQGTGVQYNGESFADGVKISGTGEPLASVTITIDGVTRTTTVADDGSWSLTWEPGVLPEGEYVREFTATSADLLNNTTTLDDAIDVDTVVNVAIDGGIEADNIINAVEASDGVTVTGTTDPGAAVTVALGAASVAATVAPDGSWSATFPAADIPPGTSAEDFVATATDAAGNTASASQGVSVDTEAGLLTLDTPVETDDVINAAEASDGVILTGEADPAATVVVNMAGVNRVVTADADGNWEAAFAAGEIAPGTYLAEITASTTDAAGTVRTETHQVQVDTELELAFSPDGIEGDNVVSGAEQADGVVVNGTTDPGSTVTVTLAGVAKAATVDAAGNWTVTYSAAEVPTGELSVPVTAAAVDPAGNTAEIADTVRIDTLVNQFTEANDLGDGIGNFAEVSDGIGFSGVVEPGSTVVLTFQGTDYAATVAPDGNWTVTVPAADIPPGEYAETVSVLATDAVGNTETLTDTITIDTLAPDAALTATVTRAVNGTVGVSIDETAADLTISQIDEDGNVTSVNAVEGATIGGRTQFDFVDTVPDGSSLILNTTDAAGNTRGTFVILDDEKQNTNEDLSAPALLNAQIEMIDLEFAEEANLTITEAQLVALSQASDELTIRGSAEDTVNIPGATRTGTREVNGETFDVYSLGQGTLIIDEDIQIGGVV